APAAIMGLFFSLIAMAIGLLSFGYFAALALSIVAESSEGNAHLHDPPPANPADWIAEAFTLGVAAVVSAGPGWLAAHLVAAHVGASALAGLASLIVCFPVVQLSQLEQNSPWAMLSTKLLSGLARVRSSWMLFTAQSLLLAAVPVGAGWAIARAPAVGIAVAAVPLVFASLLYFRLLGRLAWVVAETNVASDDQPDEEPVEETSEPDAELAAGEPLDGFDEAFDEYFDSESGGP
ncbi:MAG: hypothetical protein AAGB00_13215, partial [Planctomycetota bacterium]